MWSYAYAGVVGVVRQAHGALAGLEMEVGWRETEMDVVDDAEGEAGDAADSFVVLAPPSAT